jgi:hypothetical protein
VEKYAFKIRIMDGGSLSVWQHWSQVLSALLRIRQNRASCEKPVETSSKSTKLGMFGAIHQRRAVQSMRMPATLSNRATGGRLGSGRLQIDRNPSDSSRNNASREAAEIGR